MFRGRSIRPAHPPYAAAFVAVYSGSISINIPLAREMRYSWRWIRRLGKAATLLSVRVRLRGTGSIR